MVLAKYSQRCCLTFKRMRLREMYAPGCTRTATIAVINKPLKVSLPTSQGSHQIVKRMSKVGDSVQSCALGMAAPDSSRFVSASLTNHIEIGGCSSQIHLAVIVHEPLNDSRIHARIPIYFRKDLVIPSCECNILCKNLVIPMQYI